jgi:hypothetical protein
MGVGPIVPFHHPRHPSEDGEHGLSRLSDGGSWLYRGRLLVLLLSASGLWVALFAVAKLLFH